MMKMKKKYVFDVTQNISVPVELIAESQEEAEGKIQKMIDKNELFFHSQAPEYTFDLAWDHEISDLHHAIELIEAYYEEEFGDRSSVDHNKLYDVGIAFTSFECDPERFGDCDMHEIQVSVNLVDPAIIFYVDNVVVHRDNFESVDALIDAELSWLDFNELTTRW